MIRSGNSRFSTNNLVVLDLTFLGLSKPARRSCPACTVSLRRPGLDDHVRFEALFDGAADMVNRRTLKPMLAPRILHDAIQANAETAARVNAIRDVQAKGEERKELLPVLPKREGSLLSNIAPPPPGVTPTTPTRP